ncbi:inulinase [Apiospora arundinis]
MAAGPHMGLELVLVNGISRSAGPSCREMISYKNPRPLPLLNLLFSVAAFAGAAAAQGVSTYVNPAVPTGTPIPANYTGRYGLKFTIRRRQAS